MARRPDPFPVFSAALRKALGERLAPGAAIFLEMVSDDIVMEFPYAPPGSPAHVAGREALGDYLDAVAGMVTLDFLRVERVHTSPPPGAVVVEFTGSGRSQAGAPYEQRYISVIDLQDGRIARYRDYWNPLALPAPVGGSA